MSELLDSRLDAERLAQCRAAEEDQRRQWAAADAQRTGPQFWPFDPLTPLQMRRRQQQEQALRERALALRRQLVRDLLAAAQQPATTPTGPGALTP